jgi:ligand-binding sensor domain-containing protein
MWSDRRRFTAVFVAAALVCGAAAVPARAGRWSNHIDASMINEIVPRDGTLYVATFGGLLLYHPASATFEQYSNDSGLPSNALQCLTFDDDGNIYAGTADIGVAKVRLSGGRLTLLRSLSEQIDGLASNTINSIAPWGDVIVYGATPGAGTIRNDFASARFFERDGLPGPDVFDVMPLGDEVWMATAGGVATLNRLGIIQTVAGSPTPANVLGTDGSNIWVGTSTGVRRYDPVNATWTDVGLPTQRVHSLFWDGTTMWAGATRNFNRYSGAATTWTTVNADSIQNRYQFSTGTGNVEMKGLAVIADGTVFFGSASQSDLRGANLMHYDGTHIFNLHSNTPGANNVLRMDIDIDGSLWASFAGFYVGKLMPDGNWLNYNNAIPGIQLPTNPFANIAFLADSQGHKWFSSLSSPTGPFRPLDELDDQRDADYANDVWVRHALGSGGGDTYGSLRPVRAAEDPVGNRWFMSDDFGKSLGWQGINILSRDGSAWFQMTPTREPRMVSGNVIDVAFGDIETYVGFLHDGVYKWTHGGYDWPSLTNYVPDLWTTFVNKSQLPSDADITRLALRSDGRLWVATTAGLFYRDTFSSILATVPTYTGISPGIVSPKVQDIMLDHDENLWVATDLGLNRIARDDNNDIQTFLTPASFAVLSGLRYPLDVISPLASADCRSLAIHPTRDLLYIGTFGGISAYDFSAPAPTATDLSRVYVYPNPIYTSKGHTALKVANLTDPVTVEIYDLEGELVDSRTVRASGDVAWDLTTRDGALAGSGKYIVRIVGAKGSVQRPIALIR